MLNKAIDAVIHLLAFLFIFPCGNHGFVRHLKVWSSNNVHLSRSSNKFTRSIARCAGTLLAACETNDWVEHSLDYIRDYLLPSVVIDDDDYDDVSFCNEAIQRVDQEHAQDMQASAFVVEDVSASIHKVRHNLNHIPTYEFVYIQDHELAVRSLEPLLTAQERESIVTAAEDTWAQNANSSSSRFTIQKPGNKEAHTADLGASVQKNIINPLLEDKIYPWLRSAFLPEGDMNSMASFCVYDSLVIRYDAAEAKSQGISTGASQPLHKDLGLFSVNLLLCEPTSFQGGGTFFEIQMMPVMGCSTSSHSQSQQQDAILPLQPMDAGYALAHRSDERHAGAATTGGVRDILVFFIMSTDPRPLRGVRLKNCLGSHVCGNQPEYKILLCRLRHHYLASRHGDNEGLLYLSIVLLELAAQRKQAGNDALSILEMALHCLRHASTVNPCDARIWSNLGLTLNRLVGLYDRKDLISEGKESFTRSLSLLTQSASSGCDVALDLDACRLNYGLFLSNLEEYDMAQAVLEPLARKAVKDDDNDSPNTSSPFSVNQAWVLLMFCRDQLGR